MKIANFKLNANILIDVLNLPRGTEIVECRMHPIDHSVLVLRITHDSLDDVTPGEPIPDVDVVMYKPVSSFVKHGQFVSYGNKAP